ncbi:glutamate synthase-related protein [Bacillus spongiae]|uniref:Glutamate synthase-related protein n=1 Tax=Bacillus spongiae TaxID=2683610 RepID=A0ABU8HH92_9BACI
MDIKSKKWDQSTFQDFHKGAHDACGIVACIEKNKIPTNKNVQRCIDALITLDHRAGFINGEGDGAGIHTDIPRELWKEKLMSKGLSADHVESPRFIVGHFFLTRNALANDNLFNLLTLFQENNFTVLYESTQNVNVEKLGPIAQQENPIFLQVAFLAPESLKHHQLYLQLFNLTVQLEENENMHVASLSPDHTVYKVMGSGETLLDYYHDLSNPLMASTMTLGHNRYSTNTLSNFFRVQPFSVLGHNGEINTISKFRDEAMMIDVPLVKDGSDSQDVSRTIETLISRDDFTLFQAMEMIFPPIVNEIIQYPKHLQDLYAYLREAWGHFAQGPAGIVSRFQDEAVFSVDSLGLRPLWMLETNHSFIFSSEPGVVNSVEFTTDPKPLAPGEKVGLKWNEDEIQVYFQHDFQEEVYKRFSASLQFEDYADRLKPNKLPLKVTIPSVAKIHNGQYQAFGWEREHIQMVEQMADKGIEPIRSLGHDSPLASINPTRKNIPDFIKESVAVVTNPAIDRDRETEHFSTRTMIGKRPSYNKKHSPSLFIELPSPILLEGQLAAECSDHTQQLSYDQILSAFTKQDESYILSTTFSPEESIEEALKRISIEAITSVEKNKSLLILDDAKSHQDGHLWLDPHIVLAVIDQELTSAGLRRECSIIVRSAAIRSLHDVITAFGLGADAINPYYMFFTITEDKKVEPLLNLYNALNKGLEKVISTIGIHELRGYGRLFSSIGLTSSVAEMLNIVNFFGGEHLSFNFQSMKEDAIQRSIDFKNETLRISKSFNVFPRIWKSIGDVAKTGDYTGYRTKLTQIEEKNPTTIRHLTSIKKAETETKTEDVDISVGDHSLPFVIASMSFGSQNEIAFKAYAEAADKLNMVSLNGEGGEMKEMLGKYPKTRGQQIASGRFGVNAELLNSSNLLEIKIGQGAKPGEGGHLPGSKVTAKIAEARNATIGSDLISPSNNHDIYSIEDLAQMIHELKTANDEAKVIVKVPVVPNIGTIAVGIAKAGADIITLSGFDGGTGAARIHALQHVGLPVEIGVKAAHNALLEAGLRDTVEIWADGGIKSAQDVIKVMLLGANRIGFGTLSMIAIGCTTCRGCHLDTCHVGIATQIESEAQAKEHGLRRFVPRKSDMAELGLINLFTAFGEELKQLTASLGADRLQDLVGRSDLLEQTKGQNLMNLTTLLNVLDLPQLQHTQLPLKEAVLATSVAAVGGEYLENEAAQLTTTHPFSPVDSKHRVLGSRVSCHRVRAQFSGAHQTLEPIHLRYHNGSVPGNGLGAYSTEGMTISVAGGGQDGIGKSALGGNIIILKNRGQLDEFYNGSVGKGFGYGAQKGLLVAQGNADARAGIRLSGADMIIGGLIQQNIPKHEAGNISTYANIKGFAFEYMTNGRGLVLGDPGPWICAGMTGGVVYLRHQPEMGLTKEALQRRLAKGAKVSLNPIDERAKEDLTELLTMYLSLLEEENHEEANTIRTLLEAPEEHFLQVNPVKEQADPSVSTE